jgi:23S rRNA-/tRNA-specific pseudouridylate synthase
VKCIPFTGRTHQIRVHLQYLGMIFFLLIFCSSSHQLAFLLLGFPIVNDPLYNPNYKTLSSSSSLRDDFEFNTNPSSLNQDSISNNTNDTSLDRDLMLLQTSGIQKENDQSEESIENLIKDCVFCKMRISDPKPEENFICLHAYSYKSTDPQNVWEFKTEMPFWSE